MTLVIADAGINHGGRLDLALRLIAEAATAGADAVKFQAFTPLHLAPLNYERQAMLKGLVLTEAELEICAAEARARRLEFMCTPMDAEWTRFVVRSLRVERLKIGSGQAANLEFVKDAAEYDMPVIISNGMADNREFCRAVEILVDRGCAVTPMSCVSKYPTADVDVHLSELERMRDLFPGMPIGFSSHCRSFWSAVAAVYVARKKLEQLYSNPEIIVDKSVNLERPIEQKITNQKTQEGTKIEDMKMQTIKRREEQISKAKEKLREELKNAKPRVIKWWQFWK